jgi:hypothetical protein
VGHCALPCRCVAGSGDRGGEQNTREPDAKERRRMSRLRLTITMSLDGFVAGPDQSEHHSLGVGGVTHIRYARHTQVSADHAKEPDA